MVRPVLMTENSDNKTKKKKKTHAQVRLELGLRNLALDFSQGNTDSISNVIRRWAEAYISANNLSINIDDYTSSKKEDQKINFNKSYNDQDIQAIKINAKSREELKKIGVNDESYSSIIMRLLEVYKKVVENKNQK